MGANYPGIPLQLFLPIIVEMTRKINLPARSSMLLNLTDTTGAA